MSDFTSVAKTSELSDPGQMLVEVEDRIVVLFRVGGQYFCLDDICTHDGGPLSDGRLDDHTIACPRHGAKFDIRTGKALTMPATVDTAAHEVKVVGDDILVRICEPGELARKAPAVAGAPKQVVNTPATEAQTVEQALNPMPDPTPPATKDPHAIGAISEDRVREELKKVIDPELFINIIDLGLIYNVDLVPAADKINCKIEMT